MTKIHETFYRGMLKDFNEFKEKIKGELTVIISNSDSNNKTFDLDRLKKGKKLSFKEDTERYSQNFGKTRESFKKNNL